MVEFYNDMALKSRGRLLAKKYKEALYLCEGCGAPIVVGKDDFLGRLWGGAYFDITDVQCAYCGRCEIVRLSDLGT